MIIETKKVVSVRYTLSATETRVSPEKIVEETLPQQPFVFLFGAGMLLPDFESNLQGKTIGDKFDFWVTPENGYGIREEGNIVNLPMDSFRAPDGTVDLNMIKVGNSVPMRDTEGNQFNGTIREITGDSIKMDFNHELAGNHLHFVGEILAVRNATNEELDHGHVHGPGGHHH